MISLIMSGFWFPFVEEISGEIYIYIYFFFRLLMPTTWRYMLCTFLKLPRKDQKASEINYRPCVGQYTSET